MFLYREKSEESSFALRMTRHLGRASVGMLIALVAIASHASSPAGGSYVVLSSTIASGVSNLAGGSFTLSSSLGDLSRVPQLSGGAYQFFPGFWIDGGAIVVTCTLDLDGNGTIDPLTDGVMLVRALFGMTGTAVTNGALGASPARSTWAQIQPVINLSALDVDGNTVTDALTDGLLVMRAMLGLTGTAVTTSALGPGATRTTWAAIRSYLNTTCGTSFGP